MDNRTKEQRKKNMQAVKSKDSKIEQKLRKALWHKGIRYRKNYSAIFGKPDIVITKYKIAVFCDSEFWHGYNWDIAKNEIKSNHDFWISKIEKNIQRDIEVNKKLKADGWVVIRFWGNQIHKRLDDCVECVLSKIERKKK